MDSNPTAPLQIIKFLITFFFSRKGFLYFILLINTPLWAQINGKVMDSLNNPLSGVSVYVQDSFVGTVTNSEGKFYLGNLPSENGIVVFKSLGFKTIKRPYDLKLTSLDYEVKMKEEFISLEEITLKSEENPANAIIRAAILKRKQNLSKNQRFTANFYSKGVVSTKELPRKILGQDIDVSNQNLDSTRSGILYLSETYSKISKDHEKFKESITAVKISGDKQALTFNSAADAEFNFYQNTVNLDNDLISPISEMAFSFYRYKLLGIFYTDEGKLINQIEVNRKTDSSPTFQGIIYIVEDDWSFYGLELQLDQKQSSISIIDSFSIKQNFNYDPKSDTWIKSDQVIDFVAGIFGFNFIAHFSAVYNDYDFKPNFDDKTFGKKIYEILDGAQEKDSLFQNNRPIPLTENESSNYIKKDSIAKAHKAPAYIDSLDREANRFRWIDILGKRIQNSKEDFFYGFSLPPTSFHFNTVQGYNANINFFYNRNWEKKMKSMGIKLYNTYGFSDRENYPGLLLDYLMNRENYSRFSLRAEIGLIQFDDQQPIRLLMNDISSLFFKENFAKWYQNNKIEASFSTFLSPEFFVSLSTANHIRKSRSNTTDFSFFNKEVNYKSNTPNNSNYDFQNHNIKKYGLLIQYRPQNQYYQYTNQRFYTQKENYPQLTLEFNQAFGSDVSLYNYMKLDFTYDQEMSLGIVGTSFLRIKTGTFIQKETPAFMDFNHFHGNEIILGNSTPYLNQFNLLPYYEFSSSDNYFLIHWEHQFQKWGVGNWPLIRLLKSEFVLGFHLLSVKQQKPHIEFNVGLNKLGFRKLKLFRVDYFWAIGKLIDNQGIRLNIDL
tara:strand:+ start:574 stop:3072 length:2499 start_codon:yes stop_codon:yes gene_type:complete